MIYPTSPLSRLSGSANAIGATPPTLSPRSENERDRLSTASRHVLQEALAHHPEVRPEMLEKGHRLAVDANYPPKELIRRMAEMLASSEDPADQA